MLMITLDSRIVWHNTNKHKEAPEPDEWTIFLFKPAVRSMGLDSITLVFLSKEWEALPYKFAQGNP